MFKQEFEEMDQCCNCFNSECSCMDKENVSQQQEISLYSNPSPRNKHFSCSRRPLGYYDSNSRDSGYNASHSDSDLKFVEFAKSLGVTPQNDSPLKTISFSSMDSMDEEFFDLADIGQPLDLNAELPADFNSLINGTLNSQKTETISPEFDLNIKPLLRRSMSLNATPSSSKVRSCLFRIEDTENKSFKRPDPPMELGSPMQMTKRTKMQDGVAFKPYQRSYSATEESIKCALQRSSTEPDLIGDFTRCYCLPLVLGRHPDLKCISSKTLACVLKGEFDGTVGSCTVVDCRYPYEYEGGHINGAVNFYTKDNILSLIKTSGSPPPISQQLKRNILVFHCEFSSERGPNLYRFLRNVDRTQNKDYYPALYYPELYLLEGGYKSFYEQFPELCEPSAYLPMLHPAHQDALRHFRAKSKSCNDRCVGGRGSSLKRSSFI